MSLNIFGSGGFDVYRIGDAEYTAVPCGETPQVGEGQVARQMTSNTPANLINDVIVDLSRSRRADAAFRAAVRADDE